MSHARLSLPSVGLMLMLFWGCTAPSEFQGTWAGRMIQPEGPRGLDGYSQFLQIEVRGTVVSGRSRIEIPDTVFFGEMAVEGYIVNDSLFLTETGVVSERARAGHYWCLKRAALGLDRDRMTLSGEWHSNSMACAPGRIELHRIFD